MPTQNIRCSNNGGIDIDGKYYFFDHSNGLVTHGWIEDDGDWNKRNLFILAGNTCQMVSGFHFDENGEFPA